MAGAKRSGIVSSSSRFELGDDPADAVDVVTPSRPRIIEVDYQVVPLFDIVVGPGQTGERTSELRPAVLTPRDSGHVRAYERWRPVVLVESAPTRMAVQPGTMSVGSLIDGNRLRLALSFGKDGHRFTELWSDVIGMTTGPVKTLPTWIAPALSPNCARFSWDASLLARGEWRLSVAVLAHVVERATGDHAAVAA